VQQIDVCDTDKQISSHVVDGGRTPEESLIYAHSQSSCHITVI